MRTRNLSQVLGNDPQTTLVAAIVRRVIEELQFYDSTTIAFDKTPRGIRARLKNPVIAGGKAGWRWASAGAKYDNTKSYTGNIQNGTGEIVVVLPNNAMVTAGTVDADSGQQVYALAGYWIATQNVAPVTSGDTTKYRIPQWPPPQTAAPADGTSYDPTDEKVYWWPINAWPSLQCGTLLFASPQTNAGDGD